MIVRLAVIEFHTAFSDSGLEFPQEGLRYKIIETYNTSDGLRSRLCDGIFKTKEEAENTARRKIKEILK